jgi:hypothetical protein
MAQVAECLPNKSEALSSSPMTANKNKRKRKDVNLTDVFFFVSLR